MSKKELARYVILQKVLTRISHKRYEKFTKSVRQSCKKRSSGIVIYYCLRPALVQSSKRLA